VHCLELHSLPGGLKFLKRLLGKKHRSEPKGTSLVRYQTRGFGQKGITREALQDKLLKRIDKGDERGQEPLC